MGLPGAALALTLVLTGCDIAHPEADLDAPPVKLLHAQVATQLIEGTLGGYTELDEEGSAVDGTPGKAAIVTTSLKLRFDRFLLPNATFRQSICVQPVGLGEVKSFADCAASVFFAPTYDPVHREIIYRQTTGDADRHMVPGVTYRVSIFPPAGEPPSGIQAFDGAPLDKVHSLTFTTEFEASEGAQVDQIPGADVQDVYCAKVKDALSGCAYNNCHKAGDDGPPAEGLDMSSSKLLVATAIGRVAHGSQMGEHAREADESPLRFGRGMPIIDAQNFPGNSYLLYKLLANPANTDALLAADNLNAEETKKFKADVARLRSGVVVGMPMPPSNGLGAFKEPATLDALTTWILQGAPTVDQCP